MPGGRGTGAGQLLGGPGRARPPLGTASGGRSNRTGPGRGSTRWGEKLQPGSTDDDLQAWAVEVAARVEDGARFAGLYGTTVGPACRMNALLAVPGDVVMLSAVVRPGPDGMLRYPSLTPMVSSAFWYERAAHDLSGVVPEVHPRFDRRLLSLVAGGGHQPPARRASGRPATAAGPTPRRAGRRPGSRHVHLPLGPVRSGVFESAEFLIETPGEEIPQLNIRPHYKDRGVAESFEGLTLADKVLVAERVEGIASFAHALAFCHAVERAADVDVPRPARLIRVVHAESGSSTTSTSPSGLPTRPGLAVANARFGWRKEVLIRLVADLRGSRFGRTVVVPGGVSARPWMAASTAVGRLLELRGRMVADAALALRTP